MAKGRRKVVGKDYESLISKEKEFISQLEAKESQVREDIKFHKANLKKLEKDFEIYKIQKAEEEQQQKAQELVDAIVASGKDLDELKELLLGKEEGTETETK